MLHKNLFLCSTDIYLCSLRQEVLITDSKKPIIDFSKRIVLKQTIRRGRDWNPGREEDVRRKIVSINCYELIRTIEKFFLLKPNDYEVLSYLQAIIPAPDLQLSESFETATMFGWPVGHFNAILYS